MTITRMYIRLLAVTLAVLVSGCLEIKTTTTVNPDGTFVRELVFKGDSAEVVREYPLFRTDSTWTVVTRKARDTSWISTMTKVFRDKETLAEELKGESGHSLAIRIAFDSRFLWFTTEYAYSETLLCYNQIKAVPLSQYLTPAEVEFWIQHEKGEGKNEFRSQEDSLAYERIEKVGPEWDARNKFEAFFAIFLRGVERLNNPGLTPATVIAAKESLYVHCAQTLRLSAGNVDTLQTGVERVLGTRLVRQAFEACSQEIRELERKMEFQEQLMGAPYTEANIVMPGLITSTNAESIEGNRLGWKGFMPKCYVADFTMWAHSRVVNWWAVVLTGVMVILLTALLVVGAVRRKRVV
jgi:hypothetical protein